MHSEYCVIPQETADLINETKKNGGRVICVGTTSCRTIESWAGEDGTMTLIMLVSALAGREHILAAYEEAVKERYRFFSFGDAMFIH